MKLDTLIDWSIPTHRDKVLNFLENLKQDVYWFTVKKYRAKRSSDQNAYYWSVIVKMLSDHLGYTSDEMHEILKQEFNSVKRSIKTKYVKIPQSCLEDLSGAEIDSIQKALDEGKIYVEDSDLVIPKWLISIEMISAQGKEIELNKIYSIPVSTTLNDTYEFSLYIERIRMWAIQVHNLYIPSPKEQGYESN